MLERELNYAPTAINSIYLMGIGGVAMGALAGALQMAGYSVRGSDNPLYPPMSTFLQERGIDYATGYAAQNLSVPPDLLIVGNVIRRDNPEAAQAARQKVPYLSLPQALHHFFIKDSLSIVVAGTHGKTTTTSLVASGLKHAGLEPGYLIGGLAAGGLGNFAPGNGKYFVTEGDEYDTAFFDKRPKFVHYKPHIGILTSCEFDHADIYPDFDAVRNSFDLFAQDVKKTLIAWGDSTEVMDRANKCAGQVQSYGWNPGNDWRLMDATACENGGMQIAFTDPQGKRHVFYTPLAGRHNALNVVAGVAALRATGVELDAALKAQERFAGVARRLQISGQAQGVTVVDDFAHHPTAVAETIGAVAEFGLPGWHPGRGRLLAVFEPRSNTSRRRIFQNAYAVAFKKADAVFLREPARVDDLRPDELFSAAELARDIKKTGIPAQDFTDVDSLLLALGSQLKDGDLCLIMSNGSFDGLKEKLLASLQNS